MDRQIETMEVATNRPSHVNVRRATCRFASTITSDMTLSINTIRSRTKSVK